MEIERYYAIRGGARSAAQDHYFDARKAIDTPDNRSTFCAGFDRGYDAREAELDSLRADRDALALLLGECADELETEIHCRLSGDKATLRLSLPQRAKAKLREIGLPHGLTPNATVTRADGAEETR